MTFSSIQQKRVDPITKIRRWAEFLGKIRRFFDSRGFLEVSTDALVPAGAFEGTIDTLKATWEQGAAQLHSSPEIEMKRVLSETLVPIYQICKVFRDDPITQLHSREFTMLEFYRPHADYGQTCQDMRELLRSLAQTNLRFEEYSVQEVILRETGLDILGFRDAPQLREEIQRKNLVRTTEDDTWSDLFFKVMIEKIEPRLNPEHPTILRDYPAPICALSEIDAGRWIARKFEIYWQGMELCNGCNELRDPKELQRRYQAESDSRNGRGKPPHPFPVRLHECFSNLPQCSGVAVGLERLRACFH